MFHHPLVSKRTQKPRTALAPLRVARVVRLAVRRHQADRGQLVVEEPREHLAQADPPFNLGRGARELCR